MAGVDAPHPPGARRLSTGLAVTVALHLALGALFLWYQPQRQPQGEARWIDVVRVPPPVMVRREPRRLPPPPDRRMARPSAPDSRVPAMVLVPQAPAQAPAPEAVPDQPFPERSKPDLFELARAAAGSTDRDLRKAFPERALLRAKVITAQQKLADGIAASIAPPKLYEAPRITSVTDQGVGWGRRIDKVVTAMGTYCLTYEGNHGGDGRDVFKDALTVKRRTCPREE